MRRKNRLASEYRDEALLSERMVAAACFVWGKTENAANLPDAEPTEEIMAICLEFDRVSSEWSKLAIGDSITFSWSTKENKRRPHSSKRSLS